MSVSTAERRAFFRDLREVFARHPQFSDRIALAEIPEMPEAAEHTSPVLGVRLSRTRAKVCVKWGKKSTGERVCIQWADVR